MEHWTPLADKVDVNKYNTWLGTQQDLNVGDSLEESQQGHFDFACTHPWDELVIGADGRAGLCCLDYELHAEVGDVNKNTVQEIWQSETMNWYRKKCSSWSIAILMFVETAMPKFISRIKPGQNYRDNLKNTLYFP